MHPRSRFRDGYDFDRLVKKSPALADFVITSKAGTDSIDFADPEAVKALNQALLTDAYGLQWSVPRGALCPPIPGRSDYLHHLADLISEGRGTPLRGASVRVLDIGTGANCIYPMIGASEYGWSFVGSEIDKASMHWARQIVRINLAIAKRVECRWQPDPTKCFTNIVGTHEKFAASMCNPPFHASAAEAAEGSQRKRRNLGLAKSAAPLNFGGSSSELWCEGGEVGFIQRMIADSTRFTRNIQWFTTLVSKSEHLPVLKKALKSVDAADVRTIPMVQGQKASRMLAWTF